jgi:L-aminopeptidase/D-esterase-like protein
VGAAVAVNAFGGVTDNGRWIAGGPDREAKIDDPFGQHTTLAIVATAEPLSRAQCTIVARMASAGLARTLSPAFTPFDGDIVFCVSTGTAPPVGPTRLCELGDAAAKALATAVLRAV